ncbi:MAG TPA: hypothetical protein PLN24_01395 [Victivallales bacterium]|nr:hypothetical protein [Victivallales bacterium]HPO90517.1 hypothetical protein [Victivallales bacterium]HRU00477.1 hypothetical protein [Victivallales bacterium]
MNNSNFNLKVQEIIAKDSRFAPEAYLFVGMAVTYTIQKLAGKNKRHITGKELIDGIGDFAKQEYGPLAYEVLKGWGIENDKSIGQIVFNMIEHNLLSKTEDDKIEDFDLGLTLKEILKINTSSQNISTKFKKEDILIE